MSFGNNLNWPNKLRIENISLKKQIFFNCLVTLFCYFLKAFFSLRKLKSCIIELRMMSTNELFKKHKFYQKNIEKLCNKDTTTNRSRILNKNHQFGSHRSLWTQTLFICFLCELLFWRIFAEHVKGKIRWESWWRWWKWCSDRWLSRFYFYFNYFLLRCHYKVQIFIRSIIAMTVFQLKQGQLRQNWRNE